jgi:hypothetical protein
MKKSKPKTAEPVFMCVMSMLKIVLNTPRVVL